MKASFLAALSALTLNLAPLATAADAKTDATAGLAAQVAQQQPPKVELPPLPSDGSGIYRITLDQAVLGTPLLVYLDVKNGKVAKAMAYPIDKMPLPWPADASQLVVQGGAITGTLKVDVMPECGTHPERLQTGKSKRPMADSYQLKPQQTGSITLDVKCDGAGGSGTYDANWGPKQGIFWQMPTAKGSVSVLREAARPVPAKVDVDLYAYAALGDLVPDPALFLRAAVKDGDATGVKGVLGGPMSCTVLKFTHPQFALRDGVIKGRMEGVAPDAQGKAFTLEWDGDAIGTILFGTVAVVQGESRVTTSWIGSFNDSAAFRYPLDFPTNSWTWAHDATTDAALVAQAQEEANRPVMPGEPGKTGFWTWRAIATDQPVHVIHPPSFDIKETEGAVKYRYVISGGKEGNMDFRSMKTVEFTEDKPWRPLTAVWKDLKPGPYSLAVTPLDAAGNALPGKMRVGIMDKGKPYDPTPAGWVTKEVDRISVIKKLPFSGPYFKSAAKSWTQLALDASRWNGEVPGKVEARGMRTLRPYVAGGEGDFGWYAATYLWSGLGLRALTEDAGERALAERTLAFVAEAMESHQRVTGGTFYAYHGGYTPLSRWNAEAILDAYLQTGDPRWKNIALVYGRALVKLQNDNGSFGSLKGKETRPAGGWAQWPGGNTEFGASELLYTLGRLRRDLKTDEFIPAEKKALGWMKDRAVRDRYWPLCVQHSASQGYPVWQHAMPAFFFVRYLLELAPTEDRDVKLAEEVARWGEDYGVDWTRASDGPHTGGQLTPTIRAGDRYNNAPVAVNLLAAIAFQDLAKATGDKLWAAKADALAGSVAAAQDPSNGWLMPSLQTDYKGHSFDSQYNDRPLYQGWTSCRNWAIQLLREYAAMEGRKK